MRILPGLLALTFAAAAAAQDYPSKPIQTPDVRAKLEGIGADGTVSRSPAEFAALVRADTARYAKIVKDIGLKPD
jgi:tripartite-type tricarboxylate transporter receptor subunit TctC